MARLLGCALPDLSDEQVVHPFDLLPGRDQVNRLVVGQALVDESTELDAALQRAPELFYFLSPHAYCKL